MIISGTDFACFSCNNDTAFTTTRATSHSCNCVSPSLVWDAASRTCRCPMGSIVAGSGSSITCLDCKKSPLMLGFSADQTTCICVGNLVWIPSQSGCGCADSTHVIVGNGSNAKCISCSSVQYGGAPINSTACSCLGTGLFFNSTGNGSCSCPEGSIILPNFTCSACPCGTNPFTPYECLCPTGLIWVYSSLSCEQCGGSSLPNTLASGGTAIACICASSYMWDVMTQSCVPANNCTTINPEDMRCPTGSASNLDTPTARNLSQGTTIQSLLNGAFTNYNKIRTFQCTCPYGFSWEPLRLRCFDSTLQ